MIDVVFFIVLVIVIGYVAFKEDKKTRERYPEMFVEPEEPPKVDWLVQRRREYIHTTRKRLRREQRHTQQTIQQLVEKLSKMEKSL